MQASEVAIPSFQMLALLGQQGISQQHSNLLISMHGVHADPRRTWLRRTDNLAGWMVRAIDDRCE